MNDTLKPTPKEQKIIAHPMVQKLINTMEAQYIPSERARLNEFIHQAATKAVQKLRPGNTP